MKLTNKHNLPDPLVNAAAAYEPKPGRLGVTRLIDAPLPDKLRRKHWNDIEEDVIDRLWALRSQGMHKTLELHAGPFTWPELKIEVPYKGITLVGVADLYTPTVKPDGGVRGRLEDYKDVSVWKFVFGGRREIELQLNVLAQLIRWHDWPVDELGGTYFLRDWQKSRAGDSNYPDRPCLTVNNIPLWNAGKAIVYIDKRVTIHLAKELVECSFEERWERPTTYAVKKNGRKTALRVLDSHVEAVSWMETNGGNSIEVRPGRRVRCADYCSVAAFCPFYQAFLKEHADEQNLAQ